MAGRKHSEPIDLGVVDLIGLWLAVGQKLCDLLGRDVLLCDDKFQNGTSWLRPCRMLPRAGFYARGTVYASYLPFTKIPPGMVDKLDPNGTA